VKPITLHEHWSGVITAGFIMGWLGFLGGTALNEYQRRQADEVRVQEAEFMHNCLLDSPRGPEEALQRCTALLEGDFALASEYGWEDGC